MVLLGGADGCCRQGSGRDVRYRQEMATRRPTIASPTRKTRMNPRAGFESRSTKGAELSVDHHEEVDLAHELAGGRVRTDLVMASTRRMRLGPSKDEVDTGLETETKDYKAMLPCISFSL